MLARIREDDSVRPLPARRPLLLFPHREGQAVPHLLPQDGQPRGARRGHPRPQPPVARATLPRPRGLCGERRRPPARLLARLHGLPGIHAVRQGPRARARSLPDRIEKVSSAAWAADAAMLFYVTEDHAKRPYRLHRHRLGPTARRTRCSTRRRTSCSAWACGARAAARFLFASVAQLHHGGDALPLRGRSRRARGGAGRRARRTTSTTWTTAATSSTSAPTRSGRRNFRLVRAPVERSRPRALARADPPPRERDAGGVRRLRRTPRGPRARGRAGPPARDQPRRRQRPPRRVPGAHLRPERRSQRRVRRGGLSPALRVADHAAVGVRLRRGGAPAHACSSGPRCSGATTPRATAPSGSTPPPPTAPGSPSRSSPGPTRPATARARCSSPATAPTAFRLPVLFSSSRPEPARSRGERRHRAHPRRRRAGQALARPGAHAGQAQHVHRLHRRRRVPRRRRATPLPIA